MRWRCCTFLVLARRDVEGSSNIPSIVDTRADPLRHYQIRDRSHYLEPSGGLLVPHQKRLLSEFSYREVFSCVSHYKYFYYENYRLHLCNFLPGQTEFRITIPTYPNPLLPPLVSLASPWPLLLCNTLSPLSFSLTYTHTYNTIAYISYSQIWGAFRSPVSGPHLWRGRISMSRMGPALQTLKASHVFLMVTQVRESFTSDWICIFLILCS